MKKIFLLVISLILMSCNFIQQSSILINNIIFIDPGHGGKDNGCVFNNVYEDEINLNISSFLFEYFMINNIVSYIMRDNDYDLASLNSKNRKQEDLRKRVNYINNSNCDFFVSIHLNYYQDTSVKGPMVYFQKGNENSKMAAKIIQNELNAFTNTNKIIHKGDYYILNKTKITGVLIECGFLSNINDRTNLNDSDYQKKFAKVIYEGINKFLCSLNKI